MSVSHVADCPDLGPECYGVGPRPTPYWHFVDQVIAETVLDASLGLTDWLALEARWSLRVADVHPTYAELDGTPKLVPDDIHHHDETLVDPTDPWLLVRLAAVDERGFVGSLRLGASFPVGRTEPDPYALGREGLRHQHLQAGTGTLVPIVGLGVGYTLLESSATPVTLSLAGLGFFNAYANGEGFQAPVRLYASQRVAVSLLERTLTPFVEGILAHEGEEFWAGEVGLEGSNVRTEVYVGGGLAWRFYDTWSVDATARGRVAALTDAPVFKSYGLFSLGLSTSFDLWTEVAPEAGGPGPEKAPPEEAPTIRSRHKDGVTEFEKD
jgi:hypothetical protein